MQVGHGLQQQRLAVVHATAAHVDLQYGGARVRMPMCLAGGGCRHESMLPLQRQLGLFQLQMLLLCMHGRLLLRHCVLPVQ
jgi:hypothetical protein